MRLLLVLQAVLSGDQGGVGGHYNSVRDLRSTFLESWPDARIEILLIGNVTPPALKDLKGVHRVSPEAMTLRTFIKAVSRVADDFRPTHVHAFDNRAYAVARLLARRTRAKRYVTRPGGPNPTAYFPAAAHVICFSAENARFLRSRRKHRRSRVDLIPQRVRVPNWDPARVQLLRQDVGEGPVLLRIARITELNAPSLRQTVELSRLLRSAGADHTLVIIGMVYDSNLESEIRSTLGSSDLLVTDAKFTASAEQLIPLARGVVGSGRSLIEAAMHGAVLFAPLSAATIPTLVTESNWTALAERNFSARSVLEGDLVASVDSMVEAFVTGETVVAGRIAEELELTPLVAERYRDLYASDQQIRHHPLDFIVNWMLLLPYLLRRRQSK